MISRLLQRIKRPLSRFFIGDDIAGETTKIKPAIFNADGIKLDKDFPGITYNRDLIGLQHFADFKPIDLSGWLYFTTTFRGEAEYIYYDIYGHPICKMRVKLKV